MTITSPPYYQLKDYDYEGQIDWTRNYDQYLLELENIFDSVYKVTRDTGSLWVVADTFKEDGQLKLLPLHLAEHLTDAKKQYRWTLRDVIIWEKDRTLPWSRKGQLRKIFEYILFLSKSDHYRYHVDRIRASDPSDLQNWWLKYPERYNPRGKVPTDVWRFPIRPQGSWGDVFMNHSCPFPVALVERILLLTTDNARNRRKDLVLDPFAGSGIVLAVANAIGRRSVGFELNEDYISLFYNHVLPEVAQQLAKEPSEIRHSARQRQDMRDRIVRLRLVKYPKTLIRRLHLRDGLSAVLSSLNSIFVLANHQGNVASSRTERFKIAEEAIFLIFNENIEKQKLLESIEKVAQEPPLSKFGIKPTFNVLTRDEFVSSFDQKESKVWVYSRGIVHWFDRQISFEDWLELSEKPEWKTQFAGLLPPILSNVRVRQRIPKMLNTDLEAAHRTEVSVGASLL